MKKMIMALATAVTMLSAADAKLFTGSWIVQGEGLTLTFTGKDSVKFSSASDETISGNGTFKFTDTQLSAKLNNEGTIMEVVYGYKKAGETVKVTTKSLKVNGDSMEVSKETMTMVRPKAKSTTKKAATTTTTKKTTTKKTTAKK